jgi:site-specific DNA-methyltransferase (adenine-specific)
MINKIHLGDCLELFPKLEDNSVDLIVAGPPYNIGIEYDTYDDNLKWEIYLEWTKKWLRECYRVLKDDGRICVNHVINQTDKVNHKISRFPIMDIRNIQEKIGFNVHKLIVWEDGTNWEWKGSPIKYLQDKKIESSHLSAENPYINTPYESILISYKNEWKKSKDGIDTITESDFREATKQLWDIETSSGHGQRAAFGTIELPKRCIELLSYENDVVLDPFSGSGTTAVACKETNRKFIGFELSQNSVNLTNHKLTGNWKPSQYVWGEYEIYLDGEYNFNDYKHRLLKIIESNGIDMEILKENEVYLMGGSILRLFMNLPLNTDLDFYFVDYESYKNVDDYFKNNFIFLSESPLSKSYNSQRFKIVQLIKNKKFMGTFENIVSSFDFTISTGCFDFKNNKFRHLKTYFEDIKNKKIKLNTIISENRVAETLYRIKKYKKLGFSIDDEDLVELYSYDKGASPDEIYQRVIRKSWLRNKDLTPIIPNIDIFVNWLMDIKDHPTLEKFNVYLWGGFISRPYETKDLDVLITKRDGQHATLKELENLMVDMFNLAYDIHGFFLDTCYMRIPQWIGDYPRNKEILKSVEKKQLFITITKYEDKEMVCKYRRYGLLNCSYTGSFTIRGIEPSSLVHRWVDLDGDYARMVDLRKIIKYYDNNKERNIEDFLNKFQEYSGY